MSGRSELKQYFLTGKKPTEGQFADLINSIFVLSEDHLGIVDITGLSAALAAKAAASDIAALNARTLPAGGTTNQVLVKGSNTDYNANWIDLSTLYLPLTGGQLTGDLVIRKASPALAFINTSAANKQWAMYMNGYDLHVVESGVALRAMFYAGGGFNVDGISSATSFTGAGTGLTGTAAALNIGGNAATVTNGLYTTGGTLTGDLQQTISPVNGFSVITKSYADNLFTGLSWKQEVRAATTANITLSGTQTIDGIALVANDRVLVKNQTTQTVNGIYLVQAGAWTRTTDADSGAEIGSATVLVRNGTANKNTQWTCTNSTDPVLGTDNITFGQISGAGTYTNGTGVLLASNVFSLDLTYTDARYSLLAGSSSIVTVGTISTGVWNGTAIADSYIASASTWNAKQSAISFGTGIQTALGVNVGSAGAPVLYNGAGGTPSSITLTSATGLPVSTGITGFGTGVATALGINIGSASSLIVRDTNLNASVNNIIESYATTATAAGNTTLTVGSAYQQYFTGTTTQNVLLPVVSTLVLGMQFIVVNNSTGIVTVRSSGNNAISSLPAGSSGVFTCILTTGTTAASWNASIGYGAATTTGNGYVSTTTQSFAGNKTWTGSTTLSSTLTCNSVVNFYGALGSAYGNTLIDNAGSALVGGSSNIAIGLGAMNGNQNGIGNVMIGRSAGIGSAGNSYNYNTGVGFSALASITTGSYNSAYGDSSGSGITTGSYNCLHGEGAGSAITTQNFAVAFGYQAAGQKTGPSFVAIGAAALSSGTGGDNCTAVGYAALQITTGTNNTAVGSYAGYYAGNTLTGNYNNFIGCNSGQGIITGSYNTILGFNSGVLGDVSRYVIIADGDGHNRLVIDNNGDAVLGGKVTATQFLLSALNTAPATSGSTGVLGDIRIDGNYIYVCKATNTWVRAALSTF